MEHESDDDTNCKYEFGIVIKGLVQGLEDLEIWMQIDTIQTTAIPEY